MGWGHNELASDLASYLLSDRRMVWTDMQLGPSGSPRPDVYTLDKSYSRPAPMAYEVKISRSDLRSDTTSGKWQSYLQFAQGVVFAVPDGLCAKADIPEACGLIVRKDQVWRFVKKPILQKVDPPFSACMKLLIDGVSRTHAKAIPAPRRADLWKEHQAIRAKFGGNVALAARDLTAAHQRIAQARETADARWKSEELRIESMKAATMERAKAEAADWERAKREVCEWLGIEGQTSIWAVQQRIRRLKSDCDADARVSDADSKIEQVRGQLQHALASLPAEKREAA